jgi:COX assembly protein 1
MNNCMLAHATAEEHDRAREDWFAARMTRAREREQKERRKIEQERFHREWWGLPERDPDDVKRELEKLERPERIGGAVRRRELEKTRTGTDGKEGRS